MDLKLDFLTREILIKIITKGLGVFRTLYLLFFFSVSSILDNFYFAKSIVGFVVLINILFEINYSQQLNKYKSNNTFIKKFSLVLNKLSFALAIGLISISYIVSGDSEIMIHIALLSFWGILNINSNYFLLLFRYKDYNTKVLLYYLLIAAFDIVLLFLMLKILNTGNHFLAISLSILISEFLAFILLFSRYCFSSYQKGKDRSLKLNLEVSRLLKVFLILIIITLIDISDKIFLSFLGEGQITYYTYGLYAPLMIRQSLDIRSNFFVQINKAKSLSDSKNIFYTTVKKLIPFFILGAVLLICTTEILEGLIHKTFHIANISIFKNIIYIGILIAPLYIVWDLFYRFYYRESKIDKLMILVLVGLLINLTLNYGLGIYLSWGIYGVLISTLIVFLFYNLMSYQYFFVKMKE